MDMDEDSVEVSCKSPGKRVPIGVFWDIENCQVPHGKSAMGIVNCIRQKFLQSFREAEFMCVCDINKEQEDVIQELNNAQITVVHVHATCKNAADDKLRQCMRRFADTYDQRCAILLISGDINFAVDLSDFRHRRGIPIILLHNASVSEALIACANHVESFADLIADIPYKEQVQKSPSKSYCILVTNLPIKQETKAVRSRLKQLSGNCGGKVMLVKGSRAILRFHTLESASRAVKRMEREDVFGRKIHVRLPADTGNITGLFQSDMTPVKMPVSNTGTLYSSTPSTGIDRNGVLNSGVPGDVTVSTSNSHWCSLANSMSGLNISANPFPQSAWQKRELPKRLLAQSGTDSCYSSRSQSASSQEPASLAGSPENAECVTNMLMHAAYDRPSEVDFPPSSMHALSGINSDLASKIFEQQPWPAHTNSYPAAESYLPSPPPVMSSFKHSRFSPSTIFDSGICDKQLSDAQYPSYFGGYDIWGGADINNSSPAQYMSTQTVNNQLYFSFPVCPC